MSAQEHLRDVIDAEERRLLAGIPPEPEAAILALLRIVDRLQPVVEYEPVPDLVTGHRRPDLGLNKALHLCLESGTDGAPPGISGHNAQLDGWADGFLRECSSLAEAELVLGHCQTGFMRLIDDGEGRFDAWIATKQAPASWRERADIDWWRRWLVTDVPPVRGESDDGAIYRRLADAVVDAMAYQLPYPPRALIGRCTVQTYRDVLRWLIASVLKARDDGAEPSPRPEQALVSAIATDLSEDPETIRLAISGFTVDRQNAAYHAAIPGVAAAPLLRVGSGRIVWSIHGLTTEPFFFLTRELRRQDAQRYHNIAFLREDVFRQDLYATFQDKRFVSSTGRIQLRRDQGDIRTDVDAVVFDRKSGTLGFFELKSQDPFASSTAELLRQRDNVLYANRQISGALDWLKRHGAGELLNRVDHQTARKYRVQKIFPFVLGRYIVHFDGGAPPDKRAAWGAWPQVMRLLAGHPMRATDANPIASLFSRLQNDAPLPVPDTGQGTREIALGAAHIVVQPSYAAFRASAQEQWSS